MHRPSADPALAGPHELPASPAARPAPLAGSSPPHSARRATAAPFARKSRRGYHRARPPRIPAGLYFSTPGRSSAPHPLPSPPANPSRLSPPRSVRAEHGAAVATRRPAAPQTAISRAAASPRPRDPPWDHNSKVFATPRWNFRSEAIPAGESTPEQLLAAVGSWPALTHLPTSQVPHEPTRGVQAPGGAPPRLGRVRSAVRRRSPSSPAPPRLAPPV